MASWFRIVQERWAATAMSGEGARRYGGRWNPPGLPAVYLAESRALAALEILVHAPREALHLDWRVIEVELPDDWIEDAGEPPKGWRARPSSVTAQRFGEAWLRAEKGLALKLPSVIIPQERTLLINPQHPKAARLKCSAPQEVAFDPRL